MLITIKKICFSIRHDLNIIIILVLLTCSFLTSKNNCIVLAEDNEHLSFCEAIIFEGKPFPFWKRTLGNKDWKILYGKDGLLSISFAYLDITDMDFKHLSSQKIRDLSFNECPCITGQGLFYLINKSALLKLSFYRCVAISDQGIKEISLFTNLKQVDFRECPDITDTGISSIVNLPYLEELLLQGTNITNKALKEMKSLKKLKCLDLSEIVNINGQGLTELSECTDIYELNLVNCINITDTDISCLSNFHKLTKLSLGGGSYDGTGFVTLKSCRYLQSLCIKENYPFGNKSKLFHIQSNHFKNIGDIALLHIADIKTLQELSLIRCENITDSGLLYLTHSCCLEQLFISGCSKVSQKGINEIQKALPNCRILYQKYAK